MARKRIGPFEVDVAVCDPVDLDLAIPQVAQPLTQIMRNYPLSWERAFNGPYFYPAPKPEEIVTDGILWEGGRMWSWSGRARPCLLVTPDGRARIVDRPPEAMVKASRVAFSAGPDLFAVSLRDEMRRGEYSGFSVEWRGPQAAIGIRKDGRIVHAACLSITMPELAGVMSDLGCVQAMRLDGGSSMGVLERGGQAFGNVGRALTVAVVMRRVEAEEIRSASKSLVPVGAGYELLYYYSEKPTGRATKNFLWSEFASKRTGRVLIALFLVEMCQYIRDVLGGPVTVNSAYRDAVHNATVPDASPDSYHIYGLAVDISTIGYGTDRIVRIAKDFGWRGGLGRYRTFAHFDLGPEREWRG